MEPDKLVIFLFQYVVFLFSIVCHEAAHAYSALKLGDPTGYEGGQASLHPVPHLQREPVGTMLMPVMSFFLSGMMWGWASAPVNPYWQIRYPRRAAFVSLAGPLANFLIAGVAGIVLVGGIKLGIFSPHILILQNSLGISDFASGVGLFLYCLFYLNLLLGVFNLIPIPPLDGFSVIGLLFPEEIHLKILSARSNPVFFVIGFMLLWRIFPFFFFPIFSWCRGLLLSLL